MKILHAHKYYYPRRGAERYMLDLMAMQEEAGHTVAPFAMRYPQNLASPWSDYFVSELKTERAVIGLNAVRQTLRAFWSVEAKRKMKAMIKAFQPDVVHMHNIYTHFSPSILAACEEEGVPVVLTVHDHALVCANHAAWDAGRQRPMKVSEMGPLATAKTRFIKGSYLGTLVLALIHEWHLKTGAYTKRVDRFLAISNYIKDTMVARGFPEQKIQVQYNFVSPKCAPREKQSSGVFFLGALYDFKGVQTLIESMKDLTHAHLRIAGTGEYEDELHKQAEGMDNVEFLGFLEKEEIGKEFAKTRVAVFPSLLNEPFGLSAVEAMMCGVPVVVSNRGGLQEAVEDEVSGRVFEAGDAKDLARKLQEFLSSGPYAQSMGEAGQVRAKEISDPQQHLERMMETYQEVIEKHGDK